jgi:hypothetical protein
MGDRAEWIVDDIQCGFGLITEEQTSDWVTVKFDDGAIATMPAGQIRLIAPVPEPGDRVRHQNGTYGAVTTVWLHDLTADVLWDGGSHSKVSLAAVCRVEHVASFGDNAFEAGQVVDITITGARVRPAYCQPDSGNWLVLTISNADGGTQIEVPLGYECVTIRPAEGGEQPC